VHDVRMLAWHYKKKVTMICQCHKDEKFMSVSTGKETTKYVVVSDYNTHMKGVNIKGETLQQILLKCKNSCRKYCTIFWVVLARFCPILVQVKSLKTLFGLVTPFIPIPITHSYNHTQLLLTPVRMYTAYSLTPMFPS
jgi:hypothetical protein